MQIKPQDIKIETFKSGTAWAPMNYGVRVIHIPTGIYTEVHEGRSQHRNRQLAFDLLVERLNIDTDITKQLELFND